MVERFYYTAPIHNSTKRLPRVFRDPLCDHNMEGIVDVERFCEIQCSCNDPKKQQHQPTTLGPVHNMRIMFVQG